MRLQHIIINTLGTYGNIILSFVLTLIQFNTLSRENFGALSVLLSIAYLLTNVFDFGTVATIYAQIPQLKTTKSQKLHEFIKSIWTFQTTLASTALIVLFLLFPYLDRYIFKTDTTYTAYFFICLSILFFVWQNIISNIFFAAKKFLLINSAMNIANIIKLIGIGILHLNHSLTVESAIFTLGIIGPLSFFFIIYSYYKTHAIKVLKSNIEKNHMKLDYTLTYFLSTQIYTLATRIDLIIISYFFKGNSEIAGNYALAQRMIMASTSTVISVTQVLSPSYSKLTTQKDVKIEVKHSLLYLLIPIALFLAIDITPSIVFSIFKNISPQTILITKLLTIPTIIFTIMNIPYLYTLYTAKNPKIILLSNIMFFTIIAVGCYVFIPRYGIYIPPFIIALAYFINGAIMQIYMNNNIKKLPAQ